MKNQEKIEKKLIDTINQLLNNNIQIEDVEKKVLPLYNLIEKSKGRHYLFEETIHSLCEFDEIESHVSKNYLKHLKKCLNYKEDFIFDYETEVPYPNFQKYTKTFEKYLRNKKPSDKKINQLKENLSNEIPIEKLLHQGLRIISMKYQTQEEIKSNKEIINSIIEALKGKKTSYQMIICSKEGPTYSNIIIK